MQTGKARLAKSRRTSNRNFHDQLIDDYIHGDIEESVIDRPIRIVRGESDGMVDLSAPRAEAAVDTTEQLQFDFNPENRTSPREDRTQADDRVDRQERQHSGLEIVQLRSPVAAGKRIVWMKFVAGFAVGGLLGLVGYAVLQTI